jgi:glycerol-3-phosphate dehydrogenase
MFLGVIFFNNVDERFIQISGGKLTGFRLIAKESLELLFSDNFELTPLNFVDEVLNLSNNFNENDLKKCFEHYCVAKPTDYILRRTHISWFNNSGGKDELSKIIENFDIDGIEVDTSDELYDEGLLNETY